MSPWRREASHEDRDRRRRLTVRPARRTGTACPGVRRPSDQYGVRLQFAGRYQDGDFVRIVEGGTAEGAPAQGGLLVPYLRDGRTTAVLSVDRPRPFLRARRELARDADRVQPTAL
ncbi:oxidoreductase C-terminal domain-containing protein [Streptomyces lancefieldiae]